MKQLIKITFVLALLTTLFTGCDDDDDYSLDKFWISYGTVQGEGNDFTILLDDGSTLQLAASLIPHYHPKENQRIIANYTILGDNVTLDKKIYSIRLNNVYEVLSKKSLLQSALDADEELSTSIGNDPIEVEDTWFSAGKYLNINFYIAASGNATKHFINLVCDDVTTDPDGYVNVTLRHNAYNDFHNYMGFGRVSFDISELVPEGKNSIKVRLKWTEYDGEQKSDTGTFSLRTNETVPESQLKVDKITTLVE